MQRIPRIAAIHDLSGFGRCSLTAAVPVLSAMGVQVCPLPTAVLSTQTDGYESFSFLDLTDSMGDYIAHWDRIDARFDAIYSGFLGSSEQIGIVADFCDRFGHPEQIRLVDPVTGDSGCLYSTCSPDMVVGMRDLVKRAHVTTPNLTEALLLLGEPCEERPLEPDRIRKLLTDLSDMGPQSVVITGAIDPHRGLHNAGFNRAKNRFYTDFYERLPVNYPGSGDIFASVLLGRLLKGDDLSDAMHASAEFLTYLITQTYLAKTPRREGLLLEPALIKLM